MSMIVEQHKQQHPFLKYFKVSEQDPYFCVDLLLKIFSSLNLQRHEVIKENQQIEGQHLMLSIIFLPIIFTQLTILV